MVIELWFFLLLFCFIVVIYHGIILTKLTNFYYYHTHPSDLCDSLEKNVLPLIVSEFTIVFLSLFQLFSSLPIFIFNVLILVYIFYLKSKSKDKIHIFEPMTIVRDLDKIQKRHLIGFISSVVFSVYALVILIIGIIRKN